MWRRNRPDSWECRRLNFDHPKSSVTTISFRSIVRFKATPVATVLTSMRRRRRTQYPVQPPTFFVSTPVHLVKNEKHYRSQLYPGIPENSVCPRASACQASRIPHGKAGTTFLCQPMVEIQWFRVKSPYPQDSPWRKPGISSAECYHSLLLHHFLRPSSTTDCRTREVPTLKDRLAIQTPCESPSDSSQSRRGRQASMHLDSRHLVSNLESGIMVVKWLD